MFVFTLFFHGRQLDLSCVCFWFSGMGPRNGTDNDAAAAWKSFMKLGYEIQMYNDQTVDQMKELFRQSTTFLYSFYYADNKSFLVMSVHLLTLLSNCFRMTSFYWEIFFHDAHPHTMIVPPSCTLTVVLPFIF